ncbi:hypothetical protein GGF42_008299, partial [Coemansia sp. RSA 2424]
LIDAHLVEELRTALFSCDWLGDDNGSPPANRHTQQDASELYLFLMEKLQMPYLPLEVRMVHGADYDESDSRMVTQRVLEISLLDDADDGGGGSGGQPLKLQELLERYFFDNRVEQLERNLKVKDSDDKPKGPAKVRTNAWAILSMYPFYTPQSELGDNTAAYPADAPLVIPLLIKRYCVDSHGAVHRIRRSVMVPLVMDVTSIVSQDSSRDNKDSTSSAYQPRSRGLPVSSGLSPPPYSSSEQYQLVLRSAICHKGLDTSSGHYVSLCTQLRAMRADDLWRSTVTQSTSSAAPAARGVAKTLTMPASANSGAMATEMRVIQQFASHRAPGDFSQRRRSCPDLCSNFLSDTQTLRAVLDNMSNVDVSSIDASTALTSTSFIRHVIRVADKQQELPPPYDAQASCDANKSDERLTESREFVRFDDMDKEHGRVQWFSTGEGRRKCLDEIERDG